LPPHRRVRTSAGAVRLTLRDSRRAICPARSRRLPGFYLRPIPGDAVRPGFDRGRKTAGTDIAPNLDPALTDLRANTGPAWNKLLDRRRRVPALQVLLVFHVASCLGRAWAPYAPLRVSKPRMALHERVVMGTVLSRHLS